SCSMRAAAASRSSGSSRARRRAHCPATTAICRRTSASATRPRSSARAPAWPPSLCPWARPRSRARSPGARRPGGCPARPPPPATGLVALTIGGEPVAAPTRDAAGRLWLRARTAEADAEARLDVVVLRLLRDEVPATLETHVELQVSGKSRETVLASALPPDF